MPGADDFLDLMPHVITVKDKNPPDDYGEDSYDDDSERQYRCLVDDSTTTARTADGVMVTVALTIYVNSIPIGSSGPVAIPRDAQVVMTPPPMGMPSTRPLNSVDSHYDETGALHNQVLRFT